MIDSELCDQSNYDGWTEWGPNTNRFGLTRRRLLATLALLLSACGRGDPTVTIGADLSGELSEGEENAVRNAIDLYQNKYGAVVSIVVEPVSGLPTAQGREGILINTEYSAPGIIQIDRAAIESTKAEDQSTTLAIRDTILHAMTHANRSLMPTKVSGVRLSSGRMIDSYHGFIIRGITPEGEVQDYVNIEEGVAEALAFSTEGSYRPLSLEYYGVGDLTLRIMEVTGLEPETLARWVQTNNLPEFIKEVTGKDTVTSAEIDKVIEWYQRAYNGVNTADELKEEISNFRQGNLP